MDWIPVEAVPPPECETLIVLYRDMPEKAQLLVGQHAYWVIFTDEGVVYALLDEVDFYSKIPEGRPKKK